ncbi:MAG: RNA polymerase sigma factor, partial [Opitutaceae bacterium]|nr:RNA polymerase sigma factor [Cytophagales bacterium]
MNTKEYNQAVEEYSGRVYRFAKKLLQDDDEAADIVQDSFLRLWENVVKVENEKVKSWLFTTAYRQALLRIKLKNRHADLNALDFMTYEMPNHDLKEVIEDCLAGLPEIQ